MFDGFRKRLSRRTFVQNLAASLTVASQSSLGMSAKDGQLEFQLNKNQWKLVNIIDWNQAGLQRVELVGKAVPLQIAANKIVSFSAGLSGFFRIAMSILDGAPASANWLLTTLLVCVLASIMAPSLARSSSPCPH